MYGKVIEVCPHCEDEIGVLWDIDTDGHGLYCPYCGNYIMLCSECPERDGALICDWSEVALQAVNAVRGITDRSDFMEWEKDVKGYDGKYVITRSGEIYHVYPSGKRRQLRPYTKKRDYKAIIKLTDNNGKVKVYNYSRLVYETFYGNIPDGLRVYHKNKYVYDFSIGNLALASPYELGKKTGGRSGRRKTVFKIDSEGKVIEIYQSARQAAKENFFSYQAVIDRCNGAVKNPFKSCKYSFAYEK